MGKRVVVSVVASWSLLGVGCGDDLEGKGRPHDTEVEVSRQGLLPLVTCPVGAVVVTFSPPLRSTPQEVTVTTTGSFSNCVSVLGAPVTSASSTRQVVRPALACEDLLGVSSATSTLTWNTGESSTFGFTQLRVSSEPPFSLIVSTGSVLDGKFVGTSAVRTTSYVSAELLACDSPEGLARLSGAQTLTLLPAL